MSKNSIIIDAMGGDNAPCAVVDGCYQALADLKDIQLILVGHKGRILECIEQKGYDRSLVEIVHAEDIITNHDSPMFSSNFFMFLSSKTKLAIATIQTPS
jgi:glycerol-3-phosphate acyltransferase PlsX